MKYYERVWILCLMVIAMLMGLHFMPLTEISGLSLRRVDLLSDLFPETPDVSEEELAQVMSLGGNGKGSASDCPEGIICIEDYSEEEGIGMAGFYNKLHRLKNAEKPVRIAYFGDSFIEGDIFTGDLRDLLQAKFGGSGVGFVDMASQTAGFRQTVRAFSSNINHHSMMDSVYSSRLMGINCRYFTPQAGEVSLLLKGTNYGKCTAKVHKSQLFLKSEIPLDIRAEINKEQSQSFRLEGADRLQCLTVQGDISQVKWSFDADSLNQDQIVLYGATMDGEQGVVVDNFSLRGSGGGILLSVPDENIRQFMSHRPYDLIVLHYGLNVIGLESNKATADNYGHTLDRMVRKFRTLLPNTPILIVSVSDRDARNQDGKITTIGGIRFLVREQHQAALRNKVAFWNLFEAMGGTASIKKMAEQTPPLANKDYTHLTFRGGRKLAETFYEALLYGIRKNLNEETYENQ